MSGSDTVHASAVAIGDRGILIRGPSGSGKSSLVLGLIDRDPDTTRLVADDRLSLSVVHGRLVAAVPPAIAGKLEVRGQGIFEVPYLSPCSIDLVVDLLPSADCPRFPEEADRTTAVNGVLLPRLMLPEGSADGVARVRFALARAVAEHAA
jgi:serine kinase of HPr protein (carbohydrate metabolism regulator)